MASFGRKTRFILKGSKQQSFADSSRPHGIYQNDNFLKHSTGPLFNGIEKQPASILSTSCCKNNTTLCTTYFHSVHQPANLRLSGMSKELILPGARTSRYTASFIFQTSAAWNTLRENKQQLTSRPPRPGFSPCWGIH